MRATKTISAGALMALMAVGFVGASSAMAESTALCKVDQSPCAKANLAKEIHETSVGKGQLLTNFGAVKCNILFAGMVLLEGNPLILYGQFTYTNCEVGATACNVNEENGSSELKILKEGHEQAKVTYSFFLMHVVCGSAINCSYTQGGGIVGTKKGPLLSIQENGEISVQGMAVAKEAGGLLCTKTNELDFITTPSTAKTYISTPPTMECISVTKGWYLGIRNISECETKDSSLSLPGTFELVGAP